MAKTTNILDLNNRLEKVEKENVAQNSYTSLKNKPKINGHILTGDKSSADLGLAATVDLENLKYHKVAESESTGTYAQKLQSLATAYNALEIAQKRSAILVADDNDIFWPVNCNGNWFTVWVDANGSYSIRYGIDGSSYNESGGNVTDTSGTENTRVWSLWICEP